jgi:hypothetical protein
VTRLFAHVKDRRPAVVVTLVLAAALAAPAAAAADSSISYAGGGGTLTVNADADGASVRYSAFGLRFCFPFPCTPPPPDYDISSPQGFASLPSSCTDNGSSHADLECSPVPEDTVFNGSATRHHGVVLVSSAAGAYTIGLR